MITFNETEVKEIIDNCFKDTGYKKDIVKEISITKTQAKNGCIKDCIINRASPKVESNEFEFNKEIEKVTVPKKTKKNDIIELKEKGNQFTSDETRGNLYIKIKILGNN